MLREIKIIDDSGVEIKPEKNNLIVLPYGNQRIYLEKNEAKNIIRILQGQLNILEAEKIVRKTGDGKHKENINRKTGCSIGGAE